MSDSQAIEQARVALGEILQALQISRVVCVDDTYQDVTPIEDIIVAACIVDVETLQKALPELGDSIPADQEVLKEKIRLLWTEFAQQVQLDRAKIILKAARLKDNEQEDDPGDAAILSDLIPNGKLLTLSPMQWEESCEKLLEEDINQRTLFLFDQDFSKSGGDKDRGIKIIASLLARENTGNLICGLLTHWVTIENQYRSWEDLSKENSIPRDRFLVIPKEYLTKNPMLFALNLKWIALSPDFTELRQKTIEIINEAASTAASRIEEISIYDLDHIVFKLSEDEGMWEPDMLFRLHALFHRLESRQLAHKNGELETLAMRLRSVSQIAIESTIKLASTTWEIQQKELYEVAQHLNEYYLPIELGDIFAKTNSISKKCYILLAQPCDLMVRKNGKREPEVKYVPLAEVAPASKRPEYAEDMLCFGDDPNECWYVNLRRIHYVHTSLLDLCAFNDNGKASVLVDKKAPKAIRPSWMTRYYILNRFYRNLLLRLEVIFPVSGDQQVVKEAKEKISAKLMNNLLSENLFKGTLFEQNGKKGIRYNCHRVGRLTRTRAFGILMAYTGILCRPAYDRSFI